MVYITLFRDWQLFKEYSLNSLHNRAQLLRAAIAAYLLPDLGSLAASIRITGYKGRIELCMKEALYTGD